MTEFERLILEGVQPGHYMGRLGKKPFPWQWEGMDPAALRVLMLTCRQAGKSTSVGAETLSTAKYQPGSLGLIVCPAQDQSKELMKKIEVFKSLDPDLPPLIHDGTFEKEWENMSRIIALPGSERAVRSYSAPTRIIVDEAARVPDETIFALRPMMTGANTKLVLLTTPFGKRGYFWKQWSSSKRWKKILVRVAWDLVDGKLVPAEPEEEYHKRMLKQGIHAFYSPRHTLEELQDELEGMDELWFRQEYLCEFVDSLTTLFPLEMIQRAYSDEVKGLAQSAISDDIEPLPIRSWK